MEIHILKEISGVVKEQYLIRFKDYFYSDSLRTV